MEQASVKGRLLGERSVEIDDYGMEGITAPCSLPNAGASHVR